MGNYRKNVKKVVEMRPTSMDIGDGDEATVRLASYGTHAAPTLFPKDPKSDSRDPEDWVQLEGMEAYREAKDRGELLEFKKEPQARKFAEGDWKGSRFKGARTRAQPKDLTLQERRKRAAQVAIAKDETKQPT
tara:strand:+ start:1030 stop:1428 length:399 start_codon:yes stop_codon:yes gene_type:complete